MLNDTSLQDTILGKIVDDKIEWVNARQKAQPLISFKYSPTISSPGFSIINYLTL